LASRADDDRSAHFTATQTYKDNQLKYLSLYEKDDAGAFDGVSKKTTTTDVVNQGFLRRLEATELTKRVQSVVELPLDFSICKRPILPDTHLQLTLHHHSDDYRLVVDEVVDDLSHRSLMYDNKKQRAIDVKGYKVVVDSIELLVDYVRLREQVDAARD